MYKYPLKMLISTMLVAFVLIVGSQTGFLTDASVPIDNNLDDSRQFVCKCIPGDDHPRCVDNEEVCQDIGEGKESHCYAMWNNDTVRKMGCWVDTPMCYNRPECIGALLDPMADKSKDSYFCCCDTTMCNTKLFFPREDDPRPLTLRGPTTLPRPTGISVIRSDEAIYKTLLLSLCPISIISIVVVIGVLIWRRRAAIAYSQRLPTQEPAPHPSPHLGETNHSLLPIHKVEIKARGRFGSVWKAQVIGRSDFIAVKVFPLQDRQSWLTEQDFYNLIRRCYSDASPSHSNILKFISAEKHGVPGLNPTAELWLITEYHERGSLFDYLKSTTLTLPETLRIAKTMYSGLSYLHAVIPGYNGSMEKPSIAHRDIKSRNVLIKQDLTACIADFGLVLILDQQPGDVHNQVGTRRYMAPEVLDGSINFSVDNFLKIDVYASSLVLWELLSRCTAVKGPVGDYRMPFEAEVGSHPSLESMQDLVVNKKMRPCISEQWLESRVLSSLCMTIEEGWDQDPEARLTAECIQSRLSLLSDQTMSSTTSSLFVSKLFDDCEVVTVLRDVPVVTVRV